MRSTNIIKLALFFAPVFYAQYEITPVILDGRDYKPFCNPMIVEAGIVSRSEFIRYLKRNNPKPGRSCSKRDWEVYTGIEQNQFYLYRPLEQNTLNSTPEDIEPRFRQEERIEGDIDVSRDQEIRIAIIPTPCRPVYGADGRMDVFAPSSRVNPGENIYRTGTGVDDLEPEFFSLLNVIRMLFWYGVYCAECRIRRSSGYPERPASEFLTYWGFED